MPSLRIGTWNVQSALRPERHFLIDKICNDKYIEVLCLQDARFQEPEYHSDNYYWISSIFDAEGTKKRGCFILLHKKVNLSFYQFELGLKGEENFVLGIFSRGLQTFLLVNAYMPCSNEDNSFDVYSLLALAIDKQQQKYPNLPLIICGDFNAHFGKDQADQNDMNLLSGPIIFHPDSNENGTHLLDVIPWHLTRE